MKHNSSTAHTFRSKSGCIRNFLKWINMTSFRHSESNEIKNRNKFLADSVGRLRKVVISPKTDSCAFTSSAFVWHKSPIVSMNIVFVLADTFSISIDISKLRQGPQHSNATTNHNFAIVDPVRNSESLQHHMHHSFESSLVIFFKYSKLWLICAVIDSVD